MFSPHVGRNQNEADDDNQYEHDNVNEHLVLSLEDSVIQTVCELLYQRQSDTQHFCVLPFVSLQQQIQIIDWTGPKRTCSFLHHCSPSVSWWERAWVRQYNPGCVQRPCTYLAPSWKAWYFTENRNKENDLVHGLRVWSPLGTPCIDSISGITGSCLHTERHRIKTVAGLAPLEPTRHQGKSRSLLSASGILRHSAWNWGARNRVLIFSRFSQSSVSRNLLL